MPHGMTFEACPHPAGKREKKKTTQHFFPGVLLGYNKLKVLSFVLSLSVQLELHLRGQAQLKK